MEELMTVVEAARMLRLQPCTIRKWILERKIPFVKLGGRVRVQRQALDAFIGESLVPARRKVGS